MAGRKRATDEPEVRKAKPRKRTEGDASDEPDENPPTETPPTEPQAI